MNSHLQIIYGIEIAKRNTNELEMLMKLKRFDERKEGKSGLLTNETSKYARSAKGCSFIRLCKYKVAIVTTSRGNTRSTSIKAARV